MPNRIEIVKMREYRNGCQIICTYQTLGSPAGAVLERETTPSHTGSLSNSMHATDKVKSDNTVKSETDKLHNCYPKLPRAFSRVSIKPALRGEGGWERRIQQPGCGAEKRSERDDVVRREFEQRALGGPGSKLSAGRVISSQFKPPRRDKPSPRRTRDRGNCSAA